MARKACWHAYCKMRPDVVGHPGIFGVLHFTCFMYTKSFFWHAKWYGGTGSGTQGEFNMQKSEIVEIISN